MRICQFFTSIRCSQNFPKNDTDTTFVSRYYSTLCEIDIILNLPQVIPFRIDKGQTRAFSLVASRRARLDVTTVLVEPVGVEPTIDHVAALPIAYNPI